MIGSVGILSWLQSNVRRLMQKSTSPSYDPDTDSNEAIREKLDGQNDLSAAQVNAEVNVALNTQVPSSPTAGSLNDILSKGTGNTFNRATDSLEALRDKIETLPTSFAVKSSEAAATAAGTIKQAATSGTPDVITISNAAGGNTFSSWSQVIASAASDIWLSHISVIINTALIEKFCIEIGTGGAGSEVTKARFSGFCYAASAGDMKRSIVIALPIPIKVPSGTRIAARVSQSDSGTHDYRIGVAWYAGLET